MNTTLKIFVILAVSLLLAGGTYLLIENTSISSNLLPSGGERLKLAEGEMPEGMPEMSESGEMPEPPEGGGDHHAASFSQGMAGVGTSLTKIGVITLVVLLIQVTFTWLKKRLPGPSAQSA
jgi:hypothetical protein